MTLKNNAYSSLLNPVLTLNETTLSLPTGEGARFNTNESISVYEKDSLGRVTKFEQMFVTNITSGPSSDDLTVTRSYGEYRSSYSSNTYSNTKSTFAAGAIVESGINAELWNGLKTQVSTNETKLNNYISSQLSPLTAGTGSAYTVTFVTNDTGWVDGVTYKVRLHTANLGACTINPNSWGAKAWKIKNDQDLVANDLEASQIVEFVYNAIDNVCEITSQQASVTTPQIDKIQKTLTVGETFTAEDIHYIDYNGKTYKYVGLESSFTQITGVTLSGSGTTGFYKIKMLDTNTILVVWVSSGTTTLSAIAATINATTGAFTWGTAQNSFATNSSSAYFDIEKISTGKAVVVWEISGNAQGIVMTVSGNTITLGTAVNIGAAIGSLSASFPVSVCEIGTDKFAIVRYVTGPLLQMTVCTVAGTVITVGTASTYSETPVTTLNIFKLTTDKFIIAYDFSGSVMKVRPCSVSGTTITQGTLTATTASSNSLSIFDGYNVATDLILLAGKITSSGFMGGILISVSGTVATFNSMYTFGSVTITGVRVRDLNPNTAYFIENPPIGTVAGTDTAKVYFITINQTTKKLSLLNTEILEVHEQLRNAEKWKNNSFFQGKLSGDVLTNVQLGYKNNNKKNIIGKVKSSGAADATATFEIKGPILSGFSGLAASMRYFNTNLNSTVVFDGDGELIGIAVSATEILAL